MTRTLSPRRHARIAAVFAFALIATAGTAPAFANDGASELPRASTALTASELAEIGATQDAAEIDQIASMASPGQNVQVLLNFDTHGYDAAVLLDEPAPISAVAESSDEFSALAGIYTCQPASGPKGISYHTATAFYWCGSGSWSGGPLANWQRYYNGASANALVGPNSLAWAVCGPGQTCTVPSGTSLGYVSFN